MYGCGTRREVWRTAFNSTDLFLRNIALAFFVDLRRGSGENVRFAGERASRAPIAWNRIRRVWQETKSTLQGFKKKSEIYCKLLIFRKNNLRIYFYLERYCLYIKIPFWSATSEKRIIRFLRTIKKRKKKSKYICTSWNWDNFLKT